MPLTASGGANAVNSREEDSNGDAQQQSSTADGALPAVKKPKGVEKSKAALAKKKALKRL